MVRSTRKRRLLRALAAVVVGLPLALGLGELLVRWLVFSDAELARELGRELRLPEAFGAPDLNVEYWHVQRRTTPPERLRPPIGPDALLGWTGAVIDAAGRHYEEERVGERTPVLLYGDSFAQGVVPRPDRFQGLMDASELAPRYALLNFGVGGYGVDQAWLMLERTLGRFADRSPVVVFSIFLDSDLDRAGLPFRAWPKPLLTLVEGELVHPGPIELDPERGLAEHVSPWNSWLLDLATFRAGLLPDAWRDRRITACANIADKEALVTRILERVHELCTERGVAHFVLLFHGGPGMPVKPWTTWQAPCVRRACERAGMSIVDTRPYFDALANGSDEELRRYYIPGGAGAGHLNEAGNRVAFEAIVQGLEGRFGPPDTARVTALRASGAIDPDRIVERERAVAGRGARVRSNPPGACLRMGTDLTPLVDTGGRDSFALRAGRGGRSEIEFPLDGSVERLTLELAHAQRPGVECDMDAVRVSLVVDDSVRLERSLDVTSAREPVELDLRGANVLVVRVEKPTGRPECGWIAFLGARFE